MGNIEKDIQEDDWEGANTDGGGSADADNSSDGDNASDSDNIRDGDNPSVSDNSSDKDGPSDRDKLYVMWITLSTVIISVTFKHPSDSDNLSDGDNPSDGVNVGAPAAMESVAVPLSCNRRSPN